MKTALTLSTARDERWDLAEQLGVTDAVVHIPEIGFDGVMRPVHVPTMAIEDDGNSGYEPPGRLFAVGDMCGLKDRLT